MLLANRLEHPGDEEIHFALTSENVVEAQDEGIEDQDGHVEPREDQVEGASPTKGTVLLLEDDASFRETIRDFLTENGYSVVAVQNGSEGVREVLAKNFALILCDMMMPSLPGDMFYRAIERVHPRMGERFVFMTGYRGDEKVNDFIRSIDGYVLRKPFPLQDLLDSIAFAEIRSTQLSVFDSVSLEAARAQLVRPIDSQMAAPEEKMFLTEATPDPILDTFLRSDRSELIDEETPCSDPSEASLAPKLTTEDATGAASNQGPGRVLLVDDDSSFNEIIRDFLVESGFTVVAVHSGGAGVREVLAGDFALVLCDVMMPALPGDMFYRAVERIRPDLCERFVFMSGFRGDEKTCAFIKEVNGYMLRKPFHLQDLLDAITVMEARRGARKTHRAVPTTPSAHPTRPAAAPRSAAATARRAGSWVDDDPEVTPRVFTVPVSSPSKQGAGTIESRPAAAPRTLRAAMVAVVILLAFGPCALLSWRLSIWHRDLVTRTGTLTNAAASLESDLTKVSVSLAEADQVRAKLDTSARQPTQIAEDDKAQGWAVALESLAACTDAGIVLRGINASGIDGKSGGCRLRISGSLSGSSARANADRFRQALQNGLQRRMQGTVTTRFEKLDDYAEEASAPAGADFVITATVGWKES